MVKNSINSSIGGDSQRPAPVSRRSYAIHFAKRIDITRPPPSPSCPRRVLIASNTKCATRLKIYAWFSAHTSAQLEVNMSNRGDTGFCIQHWLTYYALYGEVRGLTTLIIQYSIYGLHV